MRLFASSHLCLAAALLFLAPATLQERPAPCQCKCGGEIRCPAGFAAYCECKGSSCSGECIKPQSNQNPHWLGAAVVSKITRKDVTPKDLFGEQRKFYSGLLGRLLQSRGPEETYHIEYEDRLVNFSFTKVAVEQLQFTKTALDKG
jgi:hypothetical protein